MLQHEVTVLDSLECMDTQSFGDSSDSGSQRNSNTVDTEESSTGGQAHRDEQAPPAGLEPFALPYYPAALESPSEARFKQLASLHLLRATYQEDDDGEIGRLSAERVLQSARRQNAAQRLRLVSMQDQISRQLRVIQAQEARMGELVSHLQGLSAQSVNLTGHEDSVLQIISDMNYTRAGNPQEMPGFLMEAASLGTGVQTWNDTNSIPSFFQICELFIRGQAPSAHLQLTLAPFSGRLISLKEMSCYGPNLMFQVISSYQGPLKAYVQKAASSDAAQAAPDAAEFQRWTDELFSFCTCFVIGQPSSFAAQHPWWRKAAVPDIPLDVMQAALEQAGLEGEQLAQIQHQWQQHRHTMAQLEEAEELLKAQLRSELSQASALADCQGVYLPLMDIVSQLKANQAAQGDRALLFNTFISLKVLQPLQLARMLAFLLPYHFRPDVMLTAGLMLTQGVRVEG